MKYTNAKTKGKGNGLIFFLLIFSASFLFIFCTQAASNNKRLLTKGIVFSSSGTTITATKKGRIYNIETGNAKLRSAKNKRIFMDQIYSGDRINVRGRITSGIIYARSIKDTTLNKRTLARRQHSANSVNIINVSAGISSPYPIHTNITATVFWVGEPEGGGSSENNALSAWDDAWQTHYGCFDDPYSRNGYYPQSCTPKENPFYFDLPYDDFNWDTGDGRRANAYQVVPWANSQNWQENESMLKNRWIKMAKGAEVCYAQWEDAGPYVYNDAQYVFGTKDERPKSKEANNAGIDASPALRDCLKFEGLNNDTNKVSWQFVESGDVPSGAWKDIVTTSGTFWK